MNELNIHRMKITLMILLLVPLLTAMSGVNQSFLLEPQTPTDTVSIFIPMLYVGNSAHLSENSLIIDHNSIALFEQIPDNYIQAASNLTLKFWHASVGYNISYGLDCLMDKVQPRPPGCEGTYDPKYNRNNWIFEFHQPPPAQNPGWWEKIDLFIERVDNLAPGSFDVLGFKHGYVDAYEGSFIDDYYFIDEEPFSGITDLAALEARHPETTFMYWTMAIARISYPDSENFNQQMRAYAQSHDIVLMDIADITSHSPEGAPCTSVLGNGVEAICTDYTTEYGGGHLNGLGSFRMAKAMWIMMARLAGWNPNTQ